MKRDKRENCFWFVFFCVRGVSYAISLSSLMGPARRSISGRQRHSLIMIPGRRIYSLFRSQTTLTSSYACKQERAVQAVSFPRKKERNSVQEVGNRVLDHLHKKW